MKEPRIKQAFGAPDAAFVHTVEKTLLRLKREEEQRVKRKFGVVLAACIALCLIFAAVGFAAAGRWGLFDFLNNYAGKSGILPEAAGIVATDPPQRGGQGEWAGVKLREAVYDGQCVYMVVDVEPAQGILALSVNEDPGDSMDGQITLAQYARENGLEMARCRLSCEGDAGGEADALIDSMNARRAEDGTLSYMIYGQMREGGGAQALTGTLNLSVTPILPAEGGAKPVFGQGNYALDTQNTQTVTLSFSLERAESYGSARNAGAVDYTDCGVRVEQVELTATPMATYYRIRFRVTGETAYAATDEGLWFEFVDGDGERVSDGAMRGATVSHLEKDVLLQEGSIAASAQLPGAVTLRGYNCWTKQRYESHTIAMQEAP